MKLILALISLVVFSSAAEARHHRHHRHHYARIASSSGSIVSHPAGCPRSLFCGCGASVEVFGHPVRSLYLASNWFKFPRTNPAPGMVAVRRGHVFVLRQQTGSGGWIVFDANSGKHMTRVHERSLAGFTIVNPRS